MNERQGNALERIAEFLIIIAIAYAVGGLFAQDIAISLGADEMMATIIKWVCFFFVILIYYKLVKVSIEVSKRK